MGVVDHASFAGSWEILESVGEEHLAHETGESWEKFEEEHTGIAADQRSGLHGPQLAADLGTVRRGIVLHLLTGTEVILPDGFLGLLPDALMPTEGRQRRIRELGSGDD
jgi:hypothetical protein